MSISMSIYYFKSSKMICICMSIRDKKGEQRRERGVCYATQMEKLGACLDSWRIFI
jgi:hypothetical protein